MIARPASAADKPPDGDNLRETQRGQLATIGEAPKSNPAADDEWLDFIE